MTQRYSKIAIIGSRSLQPSSRQIADSLPAMPEVIFSGGAKGVDTCAAIFAKKHGIKLVEYLPDWKRYGNRAAFIRNADIIKDADFVLCFWDGKSKGSAASVRIAEKKNIPVRVIILN